MPNDTVFTNEYVTGLVIKEAGDASIKYSTMGLEAFRPAKPANKARPNTHFLNRIIKETKNHNAALLAKEAAEAQARLDDLTEAEDKRRRKLNPTAKDIRERQLGNISSILMSRKRKQDTAREDNGQPKHSSSESNREKLSDRGHERKKGQSRSDKDEGDRNRNRRSSHGEEEDRRERRHRDRSRSPTSHPRRHRHRSPLNGHNKSRDDECHQSRRQREKGRESSKKDLVSGDIAKRRKRDRLSCDEENSARDLFQDAPPPYAAGRLAALDNSDPDDDMIGPAPPSKTPIPLRGRGAARGSAAMDSRFSDSYDPQSDTQMDAMVDDWDDTVEMYRDRQKWKQQGGDKLRAAGFAEDEVKKRDMGETGAGDVKWSKLGERREWDRGKD